jgi:hypothetical protein
MQKKAQNKNWIVTGDKKKFKERNYNVSENQDRGGKSNHSSVKMTEMSHARSKRPINPPK